MIKIRNKVFHRKKRQPNNEHCKCLYNVLRNRINRELKKSKKQYYTDYFNEHVNKQGIRKIVNVKKNSNKTSHLSIAGKINDREIATNFNNFFVYVGPSTEDSIPKVPDVSPSKFLRNRNHIDFVIAHVSNEEILDVIKSLENKSTGPSSIPLWLLSIIPNLIIVPSALIINMAFLKGEYPDLLKS